jgi:hypothetical protein
MRIREKRLAAKETSADTVWFIIQALAISILIVVL